MMRISAPNRVLVVLTSLFLALASISATQAQTANVRGFVYIKKSGEPVIFTSVFLMGTSFGTSTDVNGYFSITKVPPGTYTLAVSYIGYDTLKEKITLTKGQILTKKLYLKKSSVQLNAVSITAAEQAKKTQVQVSVNTITPKELNQIPTIGGEPDIEQYLQILPGVVSSGDQGGQLYIRGGSPIENEVLLDGMIVYNPFHSIGLFSVFDPGIIRNVEVYTGGFNAQYGGRISSVMDITTRDGNNKRLAGKVSASTFGADALLEGPIIKRTDQNKGSSSFIASAKTSYLDQTSKSIYSYVDTAGLPFNFTDLYGKASFNSANGSKINFFGFRYTDQVKYQALSDLNWKESGVGSNFVLVPTNSSVLVQGNFAYSKYGINLKEQDGHPRESDIKGFNMGLHFTYFMGQSNVNYGIEVIGTNTNFDFFNSVGREITQAQGTEELAGYVKFKLITKNKKFIIEPGFRAHYYASLNDFSPEPRLGMKYNVTDRFRLKFAGGIYSQNLVSATSDRDVVNLFYGFLSGPDDLPETFTTQSGKVKQVKSKLQKADHLILGFEYDLNKRLSVNVEGYQKYFTQLTNINRNKVFDDTPDNSAIPDSLKKDFIIETGQANGVDFQFKYHYKELHIWAVYSLGYVTRWDGNKEYAPPFDRRHNINLVGSYNFGKDLDWQINARWNFGSGFPFTKTQGYYEQIPFNNLNTNYTTANGMMEILYGTLDDGRLPSYHRLDLNVSKKFELSENSSLKVSAGVTNVYNRANIFYFDRVAGKRVNQLPIMPSVSVNFKF